MSGTQPSPGAERLSDEAASLLRHDLITPINLIIGYCELLLGDAGDSDRPGLAATLRSARDQGFTLLKAVDDALLADASDRSTAILRDLGASLQAPAAAVVAIADRLLGDGPADGDLAADLRRIGSAGRRMEAMGRELAAGRTTLGADSSLAAAD